MSESSLSQAEPGWRGWPWLSALGVALAILLWLGFGPAPAALVYDRGAIADGEWWRLLTAHFVHSDGGHALWDISALAIIGSLMETHGRCRMLVAAVLGLLAVDLGLWFGMPELARYCGLSGMLNGLFVVALADLWWTHRHPVFVLAGCGLVVKLLLEISAGQSLVVSTAWPSVPLMHLAGALGGLLLLWWRSLVVCLRWSRRLEHPA
ncbi:rhombosortase [Uliginosibacterium sp. TH139]|uniref:rhombosortase n=1 Tax=Uliginosibacterium sp. TH139 TaxID=2067453 RepID=UPI000C7B847B|nr:rhombosortase [Uliginosibacterium sp. TH139]PLK50674.1 rhombosortase [Uliginosibacterium sp. TH139]